ncbi:cation:proton antiporter [Pseudaestuariivita rosea]|uniref:cation:proton antiporter n=1 Tax=Pseudaestuariivita rosea TaxID=2763263 RepID=UPI00234FE809|nr:cation:proton antiporter [Pseudaestuariivita rosea]
MELAGFLVTLGVLFLAGLVADQVGRATRLPRVTMLLLLGLIAGSAGFDLIPTDIAEWFDELSIVALTMVAFLLGGSLSKKNLTQHGRAIFVLSVAIVICTVLIVALGLSAAGLPWGLSLLLGAIATATAPAAMTDVIRQSGIDNDFTDTLKGIVAIDDAWGLIVFSITLVLVSQTDGDYRRGLGPGRCHSTGMRHRGARRVSDRAHQARRTDAGRSHGPGLSVRGPCALA